MTLVSYILVPFSLYARLTACSLGFQVQMNTVCVLYFCCCCDNCSGFTVSITSSLSHRATSAMSQLWQDAPQQTQTTGNHHCPCQLYTSVPSCQGRIAIHRPLASPQFQPVWKLSSCLEYFSNTKLSWKLSIWGGLFRKLTFFGIRDRWCTLFCLGRACCKQTQDAFQLSHLTGVILWHAVIHSRNCDDR